MRQIKRKKLLNICRHLLKLVPTSWQIDWIQELISFTYQVVEDRTYIVQKKSQYVTIRATRQVGKSEIVSLILACLMILIPNFYVILSAPTLEQARNLAVKVRRWLKKFGDIFLVNQTDKAVLINGSTFKVKSLKPGTELEGETAHLIIVDEAHRVAEEKIAEILPFLATTNGRLIAMGTSNASELCWFKRAIDQAGTSSLALSSTNLLNNYSTEYKEVIGRPYKDVIEEFKPKMLADEFNAHFELVWLPQSSSLLLPEPILRSCIANDIWFQARYCCIGIDVGCADATVATKTYIGPKGEHWVADMFIVANKDYPTIYAELEAWIRQQGMVNLIVVERNGPGIPLEHHLNLRFKVETVGNFIKQQTQPSPKVVGHTVTGNNKKEDYLKVHTLVHQNNMRFNPDMMFYERMVEELRKVEVIRTGDDISFSHTDIIPSIVCSMKASLQAGTIKTVGF